MTARFLPASRVKAGSLKLGRLSVRTSDNREIGKLVGFLIDPQGHRVSSLIVESIESNEAQVEVSMSPLQFDPESRSVRILDSTHVTRPFSIDSVPHVTVEDLWVPFFHSAA
jgi:hypothetical protein